MTETLSSDIPDEVQDRILRVLERACERGRRLATAESCTGGLVASLLTDVDGCAHAFERGYISYTNAAKEEMLGIPLALIEAHGAVSRPVAIAMAEGALARSGADVAFAVTGFAGRAPDAEEGLVHFACAARDRQTIHREAHYGAIGRGAVRLECLRVAAEMFEETLA